ncbi:MAG: L-histidine N(alpha)-methyltransferase [Thermoproteota archaeon]|nr:L-histidine N(alpha)-methyltransferase [Thermoproteota archaeon]
MFLENEKREFEKEVLLGLGNQEQKFVPSKYLYDETGSRLFEDITMQPEYYQTRTELELIERFSGQVIDSIKGEIVLIELGSGSSRKTTALFKEILKVQEKLFYFPIDISFRFLNSAVSIIENSFPEVRVKGIPSDYLNGISHCNDLLGRGDIVTKNFSRLIVFFGSSIGNFEVEDAGDFLKSLRNNMANGDFLLVGFDLVKEKALLEAAYNDRNGITAKFNLNLLNRINKEMGGNFILENYSHRSFYNEKKQRIEMHIVSNCNQEVFVSSINKKITMYKNETIHTENSYKYSREEIEQLAGRSGFSIEQEFCDKNNWFDLVLLKPL